MSKIYSKKEATAFLTKAGWVIAPAWLNPRSYKFAVEDFQRMWNLGPALKVDGIVGKATTTAMIESQKQGYRVSPNFKTFELRCGCGGKRVGCRSIRATRALLIALEKVRAKGYPNGLILTTAYRCAGYNAKIGGRKTPPSHHTTGQAVDIPRVLKAREIDPSWGFRGIGVTSWDQKITNIQDRRVVHLDLGESRRLVFQE